MRIIQRVPGSVLWIPESPKAVADSIRSEAEARGVAAERVIFAPRIDPRDAHLSRYQLADLFLDTLPFNAHATATDALWAGLPLLTCMGRTFPGKVAAGMLHAVSLPELITRDLREYEEKAVSLTQPGSELPRLRERLITGRATHPLFDLPRYRASLERAYERMVANADAGQAPASFYV
jgi:protein O-GlcNAc transferase